MLDKTSKGRQISAVGGFIAIISLFLSWYGVGGAIGDAISSLHINVDTTVSGWGALGIGDIFIFVVSLLAITPAALDIFDLEIDLPVEPSVVILGGGVLALLEVLMRIVNKPGPGGVGISLKFGIFIALIGVATIVFGGFTQLNDEGPGIESLTGSAPPAAPPADPVAAPPPPVAQPPVMPPPSPPSDV